MPRLEIEKKESIEIKTTILRKVDISIPEMPEVETMVNRLQKYVGLTIRHVVREDNTDRYLPETQTNDITGQKVNGVFRRGKFIIFMLNEGAILCHNAMSGYWDSTDEPWTFDYVEGERVPGENDIRAKIFLHESLAPLLTAQTLRFHDSRKFGSLKYLNPEKLAVKIGALGPEACGSKHLYEPTNIMTSEKFKEIFSHSKQPVKVILLQQDKIAGIGNIYAAEALWSAQIDPHRLGRDLNEQEMDTLRAMCQVTLEKALNRKLNYGGLNIYRRKYCVCGTDVIAEDIKGRTTYWCPECQH